MVASMSIVRVAHIDCTTTGAPPPTGIPPISICRVLRSDAAWSITLNFRQLVFVAFFGRIKRDNAVAERRARPHRHRHEYRLGDFFVGRAMLDGGLGVHVDA